MEVQARYQRLKEILGGMGTVLVAYSGGVDSTFLLKVARDVLEFQQEEFVSNPQNRCFYCKSELFKKLWQVAQERKIDYVLDGCNADDAKDYRPGMAAGQALKIGGVERNYFL